MIAKPQIPPFPRVPRHASNTYFGIGLSGLRPFILSASGPRMPFTVEAARSRNPPLSRDGASGPNDKGLKENMVCTFNVLHTECKK